MQRGLVVVTPTDRGQRIMREAGQFAAGTEAELVLLSITPQSAYGETRTAVESIDGSADYSLDQAEDEAEREARQLAQEAFDGMNVTFDVVGTVGDEVDRILGVAEERECDHLFLSGQRRSPTGKALFGDLTQRALLNFEGPVTVLLGEDEE
ncbi:universal stress protein [Halobium salinum]|uniref:Universal stress protein n=1 Tax=Halobium salinum TaxID=1364940 RepID=A0ABD5P9B8_9EURY|nr:universal stress protein [Halobium salinum]